MSRYLASVFSLMLVLAASSSFAADELALARGGATDYAVVVPDNAPTKVLDAAQ